MAVTTYNPYADYAFSFEAGMDSVAQNLPSGPLNIDDIVGAVFDYIATIVPQIYYGTPCAGSGSGSGGGEASDFFYGLYGPLLANVFNDYTNMKITNNLMANAKQNTIISSTLRGIKENTYDSLGNFFNGVDQQIANSSNLSNIDKSVLYLASALGNGASTYWNNVLQNGPTSSPPPAWLAYLNTTNWSVNYNNLPQWVATSYLGALAGFAAIQSGGMSRSGIVKDVSTDYGSLGALIGALGLNSGKLIFKMPQGPTPCG